MAVGYRSIFSLRHGQNAVVLAAEQFRSWLALKGYGAAAVAPGVHDVAPHVQLVVTELRPPDGSRSVRYRLTESSSAGDWVTTVTVHRDGRADDWIWVDVDAPPSTSGAAASDERLARDVDAADAWWTGVPHMVRATLSAAQARDGEMDLSAQPALVTAAGVDGLISAICDPGRRGTALVAAPVPDVPGPEMISHVERLTRECVGLAGIYVLDAGASALLDQAFAPSHSVPLGAVRTFLPEVDPASTVDARRHRVLLARTIAEQAPGKLAHLLGRAHRSRALNLPLPAPVAQVDRLLSREEPETILRAIQAVPPGPFARRPGDEAAGQATTTAVREVAIAGELLTSLVSEFQSGASAADFLDGPEDMTARFRELLAEGRGVLRGHREISRRLAALQDRLDDVEDDRDLFRARLEDEQLDHAETQAELLKAKLELDRLRGIISRSGRVDQTRAAAAAAQSPVTFAELLERLDEHVLSCVAFTGDQKNALELDDFDPLGTWAAKSWDVLRVLDGYAAARRRGEFSKGVHAYLGHTPAGRPGYPPGAHSTRESEAVERSPKLRKLRVFPVPTELDPSGAIFMDAHFKIARKGLISPRIHYHDDASRSGLIYVGYIGKHLPNAHTN
ncbi:MAG TPA: hypothetical protein VFV73_20715 [Streptosporangiaceae bacterium]|nr:hypothetical protein [Streptosporangiaceae bacterium]